MQHIDNMAKVMLATGLIVAYGYAMEAFFGWYSGNQYERFMLYEPHDRPVRLELLAAHLHATRCSPRALVQEGAPQPQVMFVLSLVVNIGMWLERFVIIVTSLHRDFLPSSWDMYYPTRWDFMTFFGTFGLFFTPVLPVHALPADDLDVRGAHAAAGCQGARVARPRRPRHGTPGLSHAGEHGANRTLRADGRVRLGASIVDASTRAVAAATPGSRPTRRSRSKN